MLGCSPNAPDTSDFVKDRSANFDLELVKQRTFEISDSLRGIGEIEHPAIVDVERNLFIFRDTKLNQIIVTDLEGKINARMGEQGRGPRGFIEMGPFGLDEDGKIFVYALRAATYRYFDVQGRHLGNFDGLLDEGIWTRSSRLFFEGKSIFVGIAEANKNPFWESKTVAEFDTSGKAKKLFGAFDPSLVGLGPFQKQPSLVYDKAEKRFYTTHTSSPFIQVYDYRTKERVERFGFRTQNFRVTDDEIVRSDPLEVRHKKHLKESSVASSFVTPEYFFFYFRNFTERYWDTWNPNDNQHHLYIYDKHDDYAFLGEIKLPFHLLVVDSQNRVYLLEDDNPLKPVIGVYEINFSRN